MATTQVIRAIWNGPFYVGKLSQPVSVGDVLLKLLETAWRAIVGLIALIAASATMLVAWIYAISPTFFPPLSDSISAAVTFDDGKGPPSIYVGPQPDGGEADYRCTPSYPLKIKLENRSNETVGSISFIISARSPKHSGDVVDYYSGLRDSNRIIAPHNWLLKCYSLPVLKSGFDPGTLTYEIKVLSAKNLAEVGN